MKSKQKQLEHMKQIVNAAFVVFLMCASWGQILAQEVWSLEQCINQALDANYTVQQAQANVKVAAITERQAKAARLPNVSISSNAGKQFGRTIDPTTNQFITTGFGFNSLSLNAGMPIFNGGQIHNGIRQANFEAQAAVADAEQTANMLALQVAQAYLNVLLTEEQTESAVRRAEQSERQLAVTQKFIEAGTVPQADQYTIQAQIAREEQAAVAAQNSVDLAYLSLKQLMQLEPDYNLVIEKPVITIPADVNPENYALGSIYDIAVETQPNVSAAAFRIKSAEVGVPLAKSAYFPTISIGGSLSTNYSSRAPDFTNGKFIRTELTDPATVIVNDVPVTIQQSFDVFEYPQTPYFNQLDQNFGQGIGIQMSVPIYQNGRIRLNVERARLAVINARLQDNQTRQQLKNDIQTAIANVRSAHKQLSAAQKTVDAMRMAFGNTEKRHNLGAVNTLELTTAKTNLDNAENDLLVARYDYLFKLKILDFYQGKELKL
jgi:outer membrane protein